MSSIKAHFYDPGIGQWFEQEISPSGEVQLQPLLCRFFYRTNHVVIFEKLVHPHRHLKTTSRRDLKSGRRPASRFTSRRSRAAPLLFAVRF
jgi:hypothetical protein